LSQTSRLDFQFEQTADGRILKLLNVTDEYSLECLAVESPARSRALRN
jgi:hypothetical protein